MSLSLLSMALTASANTNVSLDFFLIQDLSNSYEDDLPYLNTQIPEIVTYLATEFQGSQFGMASFVDKPFAEFGYLESEDYCYDVHVPLMSVVGESVKIDNRSVVRGVLHSSEGNYPLSSVLEGLETYSGRDWKENQLGAILHALKSQQTKWNPNHVPLIALATDAGYHEAGDGIHAGLVTAPDLYAKHSSEWCLVADYPSISDIKKAVDEIGAKILFMVAPDLVEYYQRLLNQIGPDSGIVVALDERSEFIASAIKKGVSQLDFDGSGIGFGIAANNLLKELVSMEDSSIDRENLLNLQVGEIEKASPVERSSIKTFLIPAAGPLNPSSLIACGQDVVFEVVLAQDASDSFENDMPSVSKNVPRVFDDIKGSYPGSRFGLTAFIDKPIEPFGYESAGDYCASMRVGLTEDVSQVQDSLEKLIIRSGFDYEEAQLHAMMHSAYTVKAEWSNSTHTENGKRIIRVIALATDALYHEAGDSSLPANNGDRVLDCSGEDYPSVEQVSNAFRSSRIFPMFLTTGDVSDDYESLLRRLGLNGSVQVIDETSSNIHEAILSGLESICAYESVSSVVQLRDDTQDSENLVIRLGQRPKFISVVTKK